ncbi:MAG: alpha/beta hydrolase [bacterium]|nr:alpha/beta hydrolase [bacterium]
MTVTEFLVQQRTIATNGIHLNVVQAGPEDGSPVILLHGFPEFWYGWRNQLPALAAHGLRLIVPDQRGYNLSDKPQGITSYRMDALVADVAGLIESLAGGRACVVGHDWGAMVAWWVALRHPDMVEKLAILNVPHPRIAMKTLRSDPQQMMRSLYAGFFQLPVLPETVIRLNDWKVGLQMMQKTARDGSFTEEDLEEYRKAWSQPGAMTAMLNWYRAYVQHPPAASHTWRVTVPTLMIWGEKDVALRATMAQPSIDLCDDGRLVMLKDATHWVQHDEADQVNQLLGDFLA